MDTTGNETGRVYADADGATLVSDNGRFNVRGQDAGHTQTDGSTTDTAYAYDDAGRLTQAADTTATGCTTRAYALDASSNRTARKTSSDDCDSCTADTTTTTTAYAYDSADRRVAYDALGRTTTSGNSTLTYFANDLVRSETVGTSRQTWSLDAAGRLGRFVWITSAGRGCR
ncbi:hypothetical protein ACWC9U_34485 [Streptomyces sp. 900116325]